MSKFAEIAELISSQPEISSTITNPQTKTIQINFHDYPKTFELRLSSYQSPLIREGNHSLFSIKWDWKNNNYQQIIDSLLKALHSKIKIADKETTSTNVCEYVVQGLVKEHNFTITNQNIAPTYSIVRLRSPDTKQYKLSINISEAEVEVCQIGDAFTRKGKLKPLPELFKIKFKFNDPDFEKKVIEHILDIEHLRPALLTKGFATSGSRTLDFE
jgi:hypothetical protein